MNYQPKKQEHKMELENYDQIVIMQMQCTS